MNSRPHITDELITTIAEKLYHIGSSLRGIGGLFTQAAKGVSLKDDEFYGVGNLLKKLADEISLLEELMEYGEPDSIDGKSNQSDKK